MILAIQIMIALSIGAFLIFPIFRMKRTESVFQPASPLQDLLARKEALLKEIKEIDLDYQTGKLSEADYQELSSRYKQRGAEVLKKIDQLRGDRDLCLQCKKKVPVHAKFCPFCGGRIS